MFSLSARKAPRILSQNSARRVPVSIIAVAIHLPGQARRFALRMPRFLFEAGSGSRQPYRIARAIS